MKTVKLILVAIGKFLKYAYASKITIGVFGLVEFFAGHKFWAIVIIAWGVLLTINEAQNK